MEWNVAWIENQAEQTGSKVTEGACGRDRKGLGGKSKKKEKGNYIF